jgi:peptidyl-prolyl cis-trans isomerase D
MLSLLRSGNKRIKTIWWVLIILTVLSFVIGFSFLGGLGNKSLGGSSPGGVGSVNGESITQSEWRGALEEARQAYRQRYAVDPQDRDIKTVEQQAWRALVNEKLLAHEARKAGLKVTDNEVIIGMRTNPPSVLLNSPTFQTDGKFDPSKYQQALANPGNNWAQFEAALRQQLPVRKLQERLLASIKVTQPELQMAYRDRFERVSATVVTVPPADTGRAVGSEAELQQVYEAYKSRMAAGARTQLEVLVVPKVYGPDEIKVALDMGRSLYDRIQKGEDFAQLARDYSEGPNAEKGGAIDRWLSPQELGSMIGAALQNKKPGDVVEPMQEGGRVIVLKFMDPAKDTASTETPPPYPGAVKLSQIVVKVRPNPDALRQQLKDAKSLASRGQAVGLSKAATEKGLSTMKTAFYDANNGPPQLFAVPEAGDWGMSAKKGAVSPVFEGQDEFVIAQVAMQHAAGPPARDEVGEQLKMMADAEHRVDMGKPRADQFAAALKSGQTLEIAAKTAGLVPATLQTSRQQPDPRLAASPELLGMLFSAPPGKVVGPVRTSQGWMFARVDGMTAPPDSTFNDQLRGQLTNELLQKRQRSFFEGYIEKLRGSAQLSDQRSGQGNY